MCCGPESCATIQRIRTGGIVTGSRTVITKRQEAMAIVTVEDLQGSIEVVVFPRLYETSRPTLRDGAILLIAGRIDHKGANENLSLARNMEVKRPIDVDHYHDVADAVAGLHWRRH